MLSIYLTIFHVNDSFKFQFIVSNLNCPLVIIIFIIFNIKNYETATTVKDDAQKNIQMNTQNLFQLYMVGTYLLFSHFKQVNIKSSLV